MSFSRLAYPNRLDELINIFSQTQDEISRITNETIELIYYYYRHRQLLEFNIQRLTPQLLEFFAETVYQKGAPLRSYWGLSMSARFKDVEGKQTDILSRTMFL